MARRPDALFSLPIATTGGNITCTQPATQVYLLTWTSGVDNRLTTDFCQTLLLALDILETSHPPGVVLTTSAIQKFYSNGLDLDHVQHTPHFFRDALYPLFRRLLTYPMPTVALLNGHAFAGGLMLALMQDYRVMNPHRGFLCLIGLELGYSLRPPMMSIFREKVRAPVLRRLVLEAVRFKALDALKEDLVDGLGGLSEALAFVDEFELVRKAQKGLSGRSSYGELKREMYRETIGYLDGSSEEGIREGVQALQGAREKREREENVRRWERVRSKL